MKIQPGKTALVVPGKVYLALPQYGNPDAFHVQSVINLILSRPGNFTHQSLVGDSCIARARNNLANAFLATDCEKLLFIDSDIVFSMDDIKRISTHPEHIVGGFYHARQDGPAKLIWNTLDTPQEPRADGMLKVKYMGTGFLCIHRWVFELMIAKMGPSLKFRPDEDKTPGGTVAYSFFDDGIYDYVDGSRRWLTEDWMFCQRAMDCGFDVWADTNILVGHRGEVIFPLEHQKKILLSPPTAAEPPAAIDGQVLPGVASSAAALSVVPPAIVLPDSFIVPPEAVDDARDIMGGCYDVPGLKASPRSVLDAGAHVGLFSYWAKSKWPRMYLVAFEPARKNVELYKKNTGLKVNEAALTNHNNTIKLRTGRNSLCHSVNTELANGLEFEAIAWDASEIGKFDFVKVDTEGSEVQILSSLDLSETKAVVCETHHVEDRKKIKEIVQGKGLSLISDNASPGFENSEQFRLLKFARKEAMVS